MGSPFRLVVYAVDEASAREGAEAAFHEVARLDSLFSDYRTDSEIAFLAARSGDGAALPVSQDLWGLLRTARRWSELTDGAFDVTVGPLTRLWRWSARRGELPPSGRLRSALGAVGFRNLSFDSARQAVRLERPAMALDLGGIAKGYAADVALGTLRRRGLEIALVDAGGDVVAGDAPPGESGWRIVIPGGQHVLLRHAALATSGDRYRYVEIDGVRYSHIVDPRTGLGVPDAPTVTVMAPDGTTADVLASALTVLAPAAGRALVREVPGASARVRGADTWTSETFPPARAPAS
ncbi:MAG: FAD:protein FMN transferase [Gemmatimonadota bacterium]